MLEMDKSFCYVKACIYSILGDNFLSSVDSKSRQRKSGKGCSLFCGNDRADTSFSCYVCNNLLGTQREEVCVKQGTLVGISFCDDLYDIAEKKGRKCKKHYLKVQGSHIINRLYP